MKMTAEEKDEIVYLTQRLGRLLDDLMVRGLGSLGAEDKKRLASARDELCSLGADHLASRLDALHTSVTTGSSSGRALQGAYTSLRLFERVMSLDVAVDLLAVDPEAVDPETAAFEDGAFEDGAFEGSGGMSS